MCGNAIRLAFPLPPHCTPTLSVTRSIVLQKKTAKSPQTKTPFVAIATLINLVPPHKPRPDFSLFLPLVSVRCTWMLSQHCSSPPFSPASPHPHPPFPSQAFALSERSRLLYLHFTFCFSEASLYHTLIANPPHPCSRMSPPPPLPESKGTTEKKMQTHEKNATRRHFLYDEVCGSFFCVVNAKRGSKARLSRLFAYTRSAPSCGSWDTGREIRTTAPPPTNRSLPSHPTALLERVRGGGWGVRFVLKRCYSRNATQVNQATSKRSTLPSPSLFFTPVADTSSLGC